MHKIRKEQNKSVERVPEKSLIISGRLLEGIHEVISITATENFQLLYNELHNEDGT